MPNKRHQHAEIHTGHRAVIELLLAEEVPSLGKQGEIVRVRPGYARNYLLPYGLATVATDANKRRVEKHRAAQATVRAEKIKSLQELANAVNKYSVTLEANATAEGHLYGSIVASDISKAHQGRQLRRRDGQRSSGWSAEGTGDVHGQAAFRSRNRDGGQSLGRAVRRRSGCEGLMTI